MSYFHSTGFRHYLSTYIQQRRSGVSNLIILLYSLQWTFLKSWSLICHAKVMHVPLFHYRKCSIDNLLSLTDILLTGYFVRGRSPQVKCNIKKCYLKSRRRRECSHLHEGTETQIKGKWAVKYFRRDISNILNCTCLIGNIYTLVLWVIFLCLAVLYFECVICSC